MEIILRASAVFFIIVSISALLVLLYILIVKTKRATEFIVITDWFGLYHKISQSVKFGSTIIEKTRKDFKDKPIKEMLSAFDRLFRNDFEDLFDKLEHGVHYRVVTHYNDVMEKAVKGNRIRYIEEPKPKVKRFLREIRPLVGWRDYRIIKRCLKTNPNIKRCCDKCPRFNKCKHTKGGVCIRSTKKIFREYNFEVISK